MLLTEYVNAQGECLKEACTGQRKHDATKAEGETGQ
jgi:hypothetical protein